MDVVETHVEERTKIIAIVPEDVLQEDEVL